MRRYRILIPGCYWDFNDWAIDREHPVFDKVIEVENLCGAFRAIQEAAQNNLRFIKTAPIPRWDIETVDGIQILYGGFDEDYFPCICLEAFYEEQFPGSQSVLAEEFAILYS